jgi:hypothetical protein
VSPEPIPDDVARLLWDQDAGAVDLDRDRSLVLERVMSRGTWEAMKWLRRRYAKAVLAEFVRSRGRRVLAPRDLAYWALVCDVELAPGELASGGGRPRWAGP